MDIINKVKEPSVTILGVFDEEIHVDYFGRGMIIRIPELREPRETLETLETLHEAMKGYTDLKSEAICMDKFKEHVEFMENLFTKMLGRISPGLTPTGDQDDDDADYDADDDDYDHNDDEHDQKNNKHNHKHNRNHYHDKYDDDDYYDIHECRRVDWFIYNGVWKMDYIQRNTKAVLTTADRTAAATPAPETYQVFTLDGLHIFEASKIAIDIDALTLHNIRGCLVDQGSRKGDHRYGEQYTCMVVRDMSSSALAAPHGAAASMLATLTALGAANAIRERMRPKDRHKLRLPKLRGYVRHAIKYGRSSPELRERVIGGVVEYFRCRMSWADFRPYEVPPDDQERRWAAQIRTTLGLLHKEGLAWAGAVGVPADGKGRRLLESVDLERFDGGREDRPWLMRNFGPVANLKAAIASDNEALLELDALLKLDD